MTEKTLTTENIRPALDALRGELAPWPVVAKKQDRLNTAQLNAANSGITSSLVAQIIANTAAIRALESAITGTGLRALVVSSLPAIGTQGILYIVPVTTYDPETDADVVNYSNEYLWIPVEGGTASEGHYEQVGQTGIVINNGQLTITVNGTSVGTFTANQSGDTTAAITVPTNADYVDRTTDQTVAGVKTFSSTINGTAAKAIADEDGTSIKTGYGKLAGNQTWSGENAFSNAIRQNNIRYYRNVPSLTKGTLPSSTGYYGVINDYDSTDTRFMQSRGYISTSGSNVYEWTLSAWSSNAEMSVQMFISADGTTKEFKSGANILPSLNSTYSLGSSSYQWSSVYAQTYYYNGAEFSSKFVTTDTTQTISGAKTFSSPVKTAGHKLVGDFTDLNDAYYNNEVCGFAPTVANNPTGSYGTVWTVNAAVNVPDNPYTSWINQIAMYATGMKRRYRSNGGAWTSWENILTESNAKPSTNGTQNLGTSTNKWKTLNGINPGALSFPSLNYSQWIDLSGNLTEGEYWYYPIVDGWVFVIANSNPVSLNVLVLGDTGRLISGAIGVLEAGVGAMWVSSPAPAGSRVRIRLNNGSTGVLEAAWFIPCAGNV